MWKLKPQNILKPKLFLDGGPSSVYGPPGYQPGPVGGNGNGNGVNGNGGNGNGNGGNGNGNGNGNGHGGNGNGNGISPVYGAPNGKS